MALRTKPRWDKYDGYVGNFRGHLADDIDESDYNKVLAVGINGDGAIVVGSGQTGIKGLMIVAVGIDIHGQLLEGGINNKAGDPQDVGKHGEITNFEPSAITNSVAVTVTVGSGNATVNVNGQPATFAFNAANTAVKSAIVAVDDGFDAADFAVSGTAPNFVVTAPDDVEITAGTGTTVAPSSADAAAGVNYYGHADGSVTASKGSDGVYVGHTVEATRLIVNVDDAQP
jgi:hypothetical protein